jgi:hypothetical protein
MAKQAGREIDQTFHKDPESGAENANRNLVQEALTLYQCKDGSIVRTPRECTGTVNSLPELRNIAS